MSIRNTSTYDGENEATLALEEAAEENARIIGTIFAAMALSLLVLGPLGAWKGIELLIWFATHVRWEGSPQ